MIVKHTPTPIGVFCVDEYAFQNRYNNVLITRAVENMGGASGGTDEGYESWVLHDFLTYLGIEPRNGAN